MSIIQFRNHTATVSFSSASNHTYVWAFLYLGHEDAWTNNLKVKRKPQSSDMIAKVRCGERALFFARLAWSWRVPQGQSAPPSTGRLFCRPAMAFLSVVQKVTYMIKSKERGNSEDRGGQ